MEKSMYQSPKDTLFTAKKIFYLASCPSTNTISNEMLRQNELPEGSVIITDHQSNGKGQFDNKWVSDPFKNVTLSVIYHPTFLVSTDQFWLTIATSLALQETVSYFCTQPVTIKWPNDIMVDSQKISGILIENNLSQKLIRSTVIGIGLNVNQRSFAVKNATSIKALTDENTQLQTVLDTLFEALEKNYLMLKANHFEALKNKYLDNLLGFGKTRTFESNGVRFDGTITGITAIGQLLIQTNTKIRTFNFKEVSFIFD